MRSFRFCAAVFAATLAFCSAAGAQTWLGAWGASQSGNWYDSTLQGQTIRTAVRLSTSGTQIRLRLSNDQTYKPVVLGTVHVAQAGSAAGSIVAGSDVVVTFGGNTSVTIPSYGAVLSDPVNMSVAALSSVAISFYVVSTPYGLTLHDSAQATSYSAAGDQTAAATLQNPSPIYSRLVVAGVDVLQASARGTIVTIGDSITDGYQSTWDANHRWPDYLAARFPSTSRMTHYGVVNMGLSGGRLLLDVTGPSALARLPREALNQPGLAYVIVFIGTNDIGYPNYTGDPQVASTDLIGGYQQIIARVHELGARVILCTITPFGGSGYFTTANEATRQDANTWIRATSTNGSDGLIDFDLAIRDPNTPTQMLASYDSGDHLHPNDAGYSKMANSVSLSLFK